MKFMREIDKTARQFQFEGFAETLGKLRRKRACNPSETSFNLPIAQSLLSPFYLHYWNGVSKGKFASNWPQMAFLGSPYLTFSSNFAIC